MRIEASIRERTKRYARPQALHANSLIDQTILRETLILLVIPARRFTTAEWLVKPERILILFQWNQGQNGPRRMPG